MSILCQVIIWTMFGLYIIKRKVTLTLTFDGLISKSIGIIYTHEINVCAKFDEHRSILCLNIMLTRFGLYIKIMTVTVTLTFDRLTSKSIEIIYTPTPISVPILQTSINSGSSYHLDKVWSTDGPTNMSKAIYPYFVEGGHN